MVKGHPLLHMYPNLSSNPNLNRNHSRLFRLGNLPNSVTHNPVRIMVARHHWIRLIHHGEAYWASYWRWASPRIRSSRILTSSRTTLNNAKQVKLQMGPAIVLQMVMGESRHLHLPPQERHLADWNLSVHKTLAILCLRKEVHLLLLHRLEKIVTKVNQSHCPTGKGHHQDLLRGHHRLLAQLINSGRRHRSQTLASTPKHQLRAFQSGIEPPQTSQTPAHRHLPDHQRLQ